MEEVSTTEKEKIFSRPKRPEPEDFGLTYERIKVLEEEDPWIKLVFSYLVKFSVIIALLVSIYTSKTESFDNFFSFLIVFIFKVIGIFIIAFFLLIYVGMLLYELLSSSVGKKFKQKWLQKQPDYKAFIEYKRAIEEYEKKLNVWLERVEKIRNFRQRKVSQNLIEYKFPWGLKIYYPTNFRIIKDDLKNDLENGKSKSYSRILFAAIDFPPDFIIEVLNDEVGSFCEHFMIKSNPEMIVELLRSKGYKIPKKNFTEQELIKMYIEYSLNLFLESIKTPSIFEDIEWSRVVEAKKFRGNAIIWIEKMKFKNSNKLFIRTSKYLLHFYKERFYAITINVLISPEKYGKNIELIKTIIEKSGFD